MGGATRIVSLLPAASAIIVELGASHRLVARTTADPEEAGLADLPSVGDPLTPSAERLTELEPDLLVAWAGSDAAPLERTLAEGGRLLRLDIRTLDGLREAVDTLGALIGRHARADSLVRALDADLERARRIAAAPAGDRAGPSGDPHGSTPRRARPTVAWVVWAEPLTLAGAGSFVDDVLTVAGGRNVMRPGEGAWPQVAFESLVDRDPDVLVWPDGGGVPGPDDVAGPWKTLDAYREGRILRVRSDSLHVPGPHIGRAAVRLARALRTESPARHPPLERVDHP